MIDIQTDPIQHLPFKKLGQTNLSDTCISVLIQNIASVVRFQRLPALLDRKVLIGLYLADRL